MDILNLSKYKDPADWDNLKSNLLFLGHSPWRLISLVGLYLVFVLKVGPQVMKKKDPFDLRGIVRFYNFFNIIFNIWLAYRGIHLGGNGFSYFNCNCLDRDYKRFSVYIDIFILSRVIDFLDTIFFVLRKKQSQITGLHVFHHSLVPLVIYLVASFSMTPFSGFLIVMNSLVHVVMYSYYFLATYRSIAPYLWWKRYITRIQIGQFCLALVYFCLGYILLPRYCNDPPMVAVVINLLSAVIFLVLFLSFYSASYSTKRSVVVEKTPPNITITNPIDDLLGVDGSPVSDFYAGKSVLISGATGFIGKVLVEKILHSCPDINKIYLLIRGSKGKSAQERFKDMATKKPFTIRLKQDLLLKKVVAIESDLSEPRLSLSDKDIKTLVEEVSVVFHVAASVKFEAPLEVNMRHNVMATKELLEIACEFKKLACFVHVSTAYSNCQLRKIDERIYPMNVPSNPMSLKVTKEMIDDRPNTYTYTKAMAENVASQYADRINVMIVRPSIVTLAMNEPAEGWVDTVNGPVGLSVLGALGILQKIKVNSEVVFDLIPVDFVVNAVISIAWAGTEKRSEFLPQQQLDGTVLVFNLTSGSENPCSFYHYFSVGREEVSAKPSSRALRPILRIPKQKGLNPIQYWIHKIFSHMLFAFIVDTLLGLFGQKKMVMKAVNRMHHANEVFDFFCSNQWTFVTDNVKRLRELQSRSDKTIFNCDVRRIEWNSYARIGWLGCRRFILNEQDDTFNSARRRYQAICCLYYTVKMFLLVVATMIAKYFISSLVVNSMLLIPVYGVIYLF